MRQRLISAAVLVPVVVIVFLAGQPWLTLGIALLGAVAAFETSRLVAQAGLQSDAWLAVVAAPAIVISAPVFMNPSDLGAGWSLIVGTMSLVVLLAATVSLRHGMPSDGFRSWAGTTIAALYPSMLVFVGLLAAGIPGLPNAAIAGNSLETGRVWLLVLTLTVWSLDTFAYVTGRFLPRGHFMNHISPKKTWSGAVGGTVAAVVVCASLFEVVGQGALLGALFGVLIALSAQAGDLVQSMLKRAAGAKDSGTMIPGHGGVLDRVDSFLFAGPAMLLSLVALQYASLGRL